MLPWLWAWLAGCPPRPPANWLPGLGWPDFSANALLTGRTGGGKSTLLKALLFRAARSGVGLFLNCHKPGDADEYRRLLAAAGRTDVYEFRPGSPHAVNLLAGGRADLDPASLAVMDAALLAQVFEATARLKANSSDSDGGYWVMGGLAAVREAAHLIRLAGRVPTPALVRAVIVSSAPAPAAMATAAWRDGVNSRLLAEAHARWVGTPGEAAFRACADYWTVERPSTADKQWSGYMGRVLVPLGLLCSGEVGRILGSEAPTTSLTDLVARSAAVLVPMSPAVYGELAVCVTRGLLSGLQRACLARPVGPDTRPFVFALDEFPQVVAEGDADFFSLSRASRSVTVACVQGVESLRKALGGTSDAAVETLVGNTGLQLHCTPTPDHAKWVCDRLGDEVRLLFSGGTGGDAYPDALSLLDQGGKATAGWNQSVVPVLQPGDIRLRSGTAAEGGWVDFLCTGPARHRPYRVLSYRRPA